MKEKIKLIDEIDFHDMKVKVFFHPDNKPNQYLSSWQMRNPDSCYTGIMYLNNTTNKITYPEGAIIPEQTDRDREMLPKFIIVDKQFLRVKKLLRLSGGKEDKLTSAIKKHLENEYKRRNKN